MMNRKQNASSSQKPSVKKTKLTAHKTEKSKSLKVKDKPKNKDTKNWKKVKKQKKLKKGCNAQHLTPGAQSTNPNCGDFSFAVAPAPNNTSSDLASGASSQANTSNTNNTFFPNFTVPFPPIMSLDRSMQRNMQHPWNNNDRGSYMNNSGNNYNPYNSNGGGYNNNGGGYNSNGGGYINFANDWPDLQGADQYLARNPPPHNSFLWQNNRQNWQNSGPTNWFDDKFQGNRNKGSYGGPIQGGFNNQAWNSWGPDNNRGWQNDTLSSRPQSAGSRNQPKPGHGNQREQQDVGQRGDPNKWRDFSKQFANKHFHRQNANSNQDEFSGDFREMPADSSGMDDSSSSGGGRKRPRSLDRVSQLSKSSRAEMSAGRFEFLNPNASRASSVSDLNATEVQKPDSTSRQGHSQKGQLVGVKGSKSGTGLVGKAGVPTGLKKKSLGVKHKALAVPVSSSKTTNRVPKSSEQAVEDTGEGLLERAERMCRENREKREKAMPSRASLNAQRVGALRRVLNTPVHRFNSAHKSFVKGYLSDSTSAASKSTAGDSSVVSAGQKKHFSSSTSGSDMARPTSAVSVMSDFDTGAEGVSHPVRSSSPFPGSDVDSIRQSIESSVIADRRGVRTGMRERSTSGSRLSAASVTSSAPQSSAATSRVVDISGLTSKLPLSKDGLAKMVNAPRSRTQRLQLARILRQHSSSTALSHRRIQLDGLYDNDDGDSIGDVLKNISGLEEIGECPELKNIKLEDLTYEDKLRIAQMIEDGDSADRPHYVTDSELGDEPTGRQRSQSAGLSRIPASDTTASITDSAVNQRSRSPHRLQAASPSPNRPLSMDDLHTEERLRNTDSGHAVSHIAKSTTSHSSSPTITSLTSLRSQSPSRSALLRSPSPKSTVSPSASPHRSADVIRNRMDVGPVTCESGSVMDVSPMQVIDRASRENSVDRSATAHMDVSDMPEPSSYHSTVLPVGQAASREAGVLHEVKGLCQRQDVVLAEMRSIDNELCGMYKSLIEIVARMSGLQRRRVQLQSEGEQLSQRRDNLLNGVVPNGPVPSHSEHTMAAEVRDQPISASHTSNRTHTASAHSASQENGQGGRNSTEKQSDPHTGVVLPGWLSSMNTPAPMHPPDGSETRKGVTSHDTTSDICLSGSVSSSMGSATPLACSQVTSLDNSVDSVREAAPVVNRRDPMSKSPVAVKEREDRASRVMLSISGTVDSGLDQEMTLSTVSSMSEAGQSAVKRSVGADSSSGVGSSVSTNTTVRQSVRSSPTHCSSHQDPTSSSTVTNPESQQSSSLHAADSARNVQSLSSPLPSGVNSTSQNSLLPKSSGINVSYIGPLSSDLVQQIVRNLPLTSRLGEKSSPSMYIVRPGSSAGDVSSDNQTPDGRGRSQSVDSPAVKARVRTLSMHSVSSDLSAGEQSVSAEVPPLKLSEEREKAGSKTCTPRSESDAHSITSGTSLGEQIKLFSERNSSSQGTASTLSSLSLPGTTRSEEHKAADSSFDMPDCSVMLERLDTESITIIDNWKIEEEKRKKRKTKKDRDQSLQRRRRFVNESSSDAGEEEGTMVDDMHPDSASLVQDGSTLSSLELMEADCGVDNDLDTTLVPGRDPLSQDTPSDDDKVDTSHMSSLVRSTSPSRLKLHPDNLKSFRANVRSSLTTSSTTDSGIESVRPTSGSDTSVSKECLKISGPCAPVMGVMVHNNLLYAGFQGIGVHSYTLKGEVSGEYPVETAQCFTLTPVGSGSQHHLAVGCGDGLAFLSTSDQGVVSRVDADSKVVCVLVVDASLFAGMDTGSILVVSLTTLQQTRHFQASDCCVQSMTWTREGSTRLLIVASQDANIHVLDASSGLPVRIITDHSKTSFTLCMLEHFVLSGAGDRKVMAHNVHNTALAWELHDHKGIVTSLCVDNGLLFTAGYDKIIRCYDLKSRKLLHLMYGAGKCIIMKMAVHNSVLYTGNRDGEIEAVDLRDMGSFACECISCGAVYGLKEHLWHHLVADHLMPNTQAMRCPWSHCCTMLDTRSAPVKAGEHLRRHIDGNQTLDMTAAS